MNNNNPFNSLWIFAHRGYRAKYPENTMIAFQAALDAGFPMIELDITLSRDRKPIVIHDETLERTTNGQGPVNHFTLKKLKKLDAGEWFDRRFAGQRLPTLEEVLELAKKGAYLDIEIKAHAYEANHPRDAIEKQVVKLIKRRKIQDCVLISSFDRRILEQVASMKNPPAIALISKDPADRLTAEWCMRLKVFSWHPDHQIVTSKQVKMMHAAGIKVFPYNVDNLKAFTKMMEMNVDGIITNDPVQAGQWSQLRKAA